MTPVKRVKNPVKPGPRTRPPPIKKRLNWRRGSESNDVFTDNQPQYPDLQSNFDIDSKGLQAVSSTTRHLPDLTRHLHPAHPVIEEIVEGFVESFFTDRAALNYGELTR